MSSDWLFLLDSEWSIPPGSNSANMCAGAIVKQASSFRNFNDLLVEILANSNIVLNEDSALEYLRQQGYIARRRYSDIGRIVTEAKVVRSKKG